MEIHYFFGSTFEFFFPYNHLNLEDFIFFQVVFLVFFLFLIVKKEMIYGFLEAVVVSLTLFIDKEEVLAIE